MYILKSFPVLIFALFTIASCDSTPVIQEHTIKEIAEIKSTIKEIYKLLPAATTEKEFSPNNRIENLGVSENSSGTELFVIDEEYMRWIVNGDNIEKDHDDELGTWLTNYEWDLLDTTEYEYKLLGEDERENGVKKLYSMNHIVVFRIEELSEGEVRGNQILEEGFVKCWMWLVDWKKKKLVGCKRFELVTSSDFESSPGMRHMRINLKNKIHEAANLILNEWGADDAGKYLY